MLSYIWSFKEAANTHLKSAGNCFLLSDSSCKSVGLIVETSASIFFLKLPWVFRGEPKEFDYIYQLLFEAVCFYETMDDITGVIHIAVDGSK